MKLKPFILTATLGGLFLFTHEIKSQEPARMSKSEQEEMDRLQKKDRSIQAQQNAADRKRMNDAKAKSEEAKLKAKEAKRVQNEASSASSESKRAVRAESKAQKERKNADEQAKRAAAARERSDQNNAVSNDR